ncbi:hypothetical protein SR882_04360 [Guyparkeria halophila]|uniref:UDP-2,4-diacetamido-2,4, 6-trideoxy-beta-L-altropyranose hydrolase n=1 Tax=Guyparkeria halophila TaxID=47960 RepID=A0ABZ0YY86_9GAMM|nr:hypothetical protein [Guyparkeria halophila]WQH17143.1 hypothetical protein SR882_04360 [Guyparkeria halophila]
MELIPEGASTTEEIEHLDLARRSVDRVIIDHPHLDAGSAAWLGSRGIPWLTFTHRDHWLGEPDWLVNIRPGLAPRQASGRTRFLHGPAYAVLREEFAEACEAAYRSLGENPRLFVTFGGGDDFGAGECLLPPLLEAFPELAVDVVTTRANSGLAVIEALCRTHGKRAALHVGPDRMQPLMCRAGAALIAGGTTTYELAAVGIPFLVVTLVENQRAQAAAWADLGAAVDLGSVDERSVGDRAVTAVDALVRDAGACQAMRQAGRRQVDGRGAERILEALAQSPRR